MIVIQYICVLLYALMLPEFTYSKAVGKSKPNSNVDPTECPSDDPVCTETKTMEYMSVVDKSGSYKYMVWLPYFENRANEYVSDNVNDINSETQYDSVSSVGNYFKGMVDELPGKYPKHKIKRALELVEEHPPEGTYRSPSAEREEPRTIRALPNNIPSIPSMPQMPSTPSIPQPPTNSPVNFQNENRETANDISTVSTATTEVEVIDTTTEDYGNMGEPNCEYDPFTYVLKCGLNLITSIFGLSDTCCKPLF